MRSQNITYELKVVHSATLTIRTHVGDVHDNSGVSTTFCSPVIMIHQPLRDRQMN